MNRIVRKIVVILFVLLGMTALLEAQQKVFTLKECILYAQENSTSIGRAQNQVESQASLLEQSKAAFGPGLSASGSGNFSSSNSYSDLTGKWSRDESSSMNFSLNSSITLYNGAKLKNTLLQNRSNLAAAESDIQTQNEIIALQVLAAYVDVLQAKEQLKISENQYALTEEQLEMSKAKKEIGTLSPSDYLNIKSQLASEKSSLISAKNTLRIQFVSLMQVMNMPIDDAFDIKTPDLVKQLLISTTTDPNYVYNVALGLQPSIQTAKYNLDGAKINLKLAKADALPELTLNGSLSTNFLNQATPDFTDQLSHQLTPSLGLNLSIPIYQKKQVKNKVKQAQIEQSNYEFALTDVKNDLRQSIEQACTDTKIANSNLEALTEQVEAEEEAYKLSEEMFQLGLINSVDYLSSKNNLTAAQNNQTKAKYSVVLQKKIMDYYLGNPITF